MSSQSFNAVEDNVHSSALILFSYSCSVPVLVQCSMQGQKASQSHKSAGTIIEAFPCHFPPSPTMIACFNPSTLPKIKIRVASIDALLLPPDTISCSITSGTIRATYTLTEHSSCGKFLFCLQKLIIVTLKRCRIFQGKT